MSRSQQRACLKLIAAGASPIAVCLKLGVLIESFDLTCEREPLFRQRLERIDRALDENVDAAIYREALKGSTAAQANWKRNRTETRQPEPAEVTGDDLDQMTTQQLLDWQARLMKLGSSPDIETDPS